jgi:hypothetical protein
VPGYVSIGGNIGYATFNSFARNVMKEKQNRIQKLHFGFPITFNQAIQWVLGEFNDNQLFLQSDCLLRSPRTVYWVGSISNPGNLFQLRFWGPWFAFRSEHPAILKFAFRQSFCCSVNNRFLICHDFKYGKKRIIAKSVAPAAIGAPAQASVGTTREKGKGKSKKNCTLKQT